MTVPLWLIAISWTLGALIIYAAGCWAIWLLTEKPRKRLAWWLATHVRWP